MQTGGDTPSQGAQAGFDPDAPAEGDGIYGLPTDPEHSGVILIPAPWDATTSYGAGAARGPEAILRASRQVDLFDREVGRPYEDGIAMLTPAGPVQAWSSEARALASEARDAMGARRAELLRRIDDLGDSLNQWVHATASAWLDRGRLVGLVGGDHSTPFGLIRALAERHPGFGILQLDAHCDLREAYEGFRWSHASIFWNVLRGVPEVARLVQVGVRDFATREDHLIRNSGGRVITFFDPDLRRRVHEGVPWGRLVEEVIAALPPEVYLSFDIDGLDPSLCPHTGTPVPGGLSFSETASLLRLLLESGRRVIGFDLCEVAPDPEGKDEWDANVGARLLYKMIGFARRR